MRFPSRRDTQLVLLLQHAGIAFLLGAVVLVTVAALVDSELLLVLGGVSLTLGVGCFWTLRVTWYDTSADGLRIRCGPSRMTIAWENIERVLPSRDRRNAPALSYERLQLDYRRGSRQRTVLVSPDDREMFLQHVQRHAGLVREGGHLLRRQADLSADARRPGE
jgi:hypothetical protein